MAAAAESKVASQYAYDVLVNEGEGAGAPFKSGKDCIIKSVLWVFDRPVHIYRRMKRWQPPQTARWPRGSPMTCW